MKNVFVLSAAILGLMAATNASAVAHAGSTSEAKGVIYHCGKNHVVDIFGDEGSNKGFSASIDHTASIPMVGVEHIPADPKHGLPTAVTMMVFSDIIVQQKSMVIAQSEARVKEGGDHGVSIAVYAGKDAKNPKLLWKHRNCYAEKQ